MAVAVATVTAGTFYFPYVNPRSPQFVEFIEGNALTRSVAEEEAAAMVIEDMVEVATAVVVGMVAVVVDMVAVVAVDMIVLVITWSVIVSDCIQ